MSAECHDLLMRAARASQLVALFVAAIVATGCGSSGGRGVSSRSRTNVSGAGRGSSFPPVPKTLPTPGPTGRPANPAAVKVIRAWSSALRRGDVRTAARYFALPSEFINGADATGNTPVIAIHTMAEAAAVNATLPCGAVFISADQRGRYVNALFRLTDRPGPGGGCGSGAGQKARTNFVVTGGHIVEWFRAPQDPGDNQGGTPPPGSGTPPPGSGSPPAPQGGGSAI